MIELCNLRKEKPAFPYDVKVDRSSVLGNPFKEGDRDWQCDRYCDTFEERMDNRPGMQAEMNRINELHKKHGKVRLFCWCVPLRCHSITIKKYLEEMI